MTQTRVEDSAVNNLAQQEAALDENVYLFPASLEQIRYWTLDQLDGDSTASNMAIAARLEGKVEDALVERAIQAIVERHEALRTTFRLVDGRLCQIISEEARYQFSVTDLRMLPVADPTQSVEAVAEAAIEEHSHARASLAVGPALFVRLIHLSDELHFLAFTMHHIVCDGWSNGILIRDFAEFYAAFTQSRNPALPELPIQFADFTVWQQNWLESDAARSALAFWRNLIRRELPAVDLPTDRPRQPQKSYPGRIESTLLPSTLAARLKAYCRTHNATMHQVLLAAFEALIARYANQREFLLGSTIANRTQPGMENAVGRFANPQVVPADVSGDPTYKELLLRVTQWSAESYAHQDLPFSRLMEEFQLDQAGSTSQFLQVYFVYQKAFMQPQEAGGLKVVPRPSVSGGVNFDLLVSIVERSEGPRLQMEYNTVLFRKERILSLIEMYIRVLEAVMTDDSLKVSQLPLVAQREAAPQTIEESRASAHTASDSLPHMSLAQWLDRHADNLGDTPAVLIGEERISWNTLRDRSRSMAFALQARGITAGKTVALRLESSANDAAAAWALLSIGAIALPLPASANPAEWTRVLSSQQPLFALASAAFAASVSGVTPYEHLLGKSSSEAQHSGPQHSGSEVRYAEPSSVAWHGLASSQDGNLVATPSTHQATLHQLLAAARALDLRASDVVLVTPAESATDAFVDLLLPLVSGSTLLYMGDKMPDNSQTLLDQHQVSFVFVSGPTVLTALHHQWPGDRRLNVVVRGGVLTTAQARRMSASPIRLWALVSSASAAGPAAVAKVLPGARPEFNAFPGQRLVILDDNNHPAPAGVFGELAVTSGAATSRTGYLARSAHRRSPEDMLADGPVASFEILDSVSRLVRLHGYRLRLGELEEILWQSLAVADVVATILSRDGNPTLVAYFQCFDSSPSNIRAVREHVHALAPGHVAGAELIAVESIPRHVDGSADLALLPAPGAVKPEESSTDEFVPPRDELETNLVAIWEEVLGVRPIGIRTQFFKLGGYSLMIVRLFARINKALGTSLPITAIFNAPTIEQLADLIRGRAYFSTVVPVQTKGTRPPFFMIHSYLLYQGIPAVLGDDYPFYGLRELDTDEKDITVEKRAANCLEAMRSVQPKGPFYIGGWCAAGPLAVETARQIVAGGDRVGFLVLFDSWRPGYATELAHEQAGTAEMSLSARLNRKYRFHRNRWRTLSSKQKFRYVTAAIGNKLSSMRDKFYLKNWAKAEWFCRTFGLPLPPFMHNVSLTTLNALKEYRGVEPYLGSLTLIRAKEAPYIPGAKEHCGWDAIVKGGVRVLWAPGDHESMFLPPHLETVGKLLRQSLAEAYAQEQP